MPATAGAEASCNQHMSCASCAGQTAPRFQNTHLLGGQAAAKPSTTWLHLSDKQAAHLLKAESFCLYLLPFFSPLFSPALLIGAGFERCRHPQKQCGTMRPRLTFVKLLQLKSAGAERAERRQTLSASTQSGKIKKNNLVRLQNSAENPLGKP